MRFFVVAVLEDRGGEREQSLARIYLGAENGVLELSS